MNKILAVIAEYNPFHNGHLYHLQKSKKIVNPDYSICILSGNFCQRGEPSIIDKWSKAEIALKCGFDMVIELPLIYSLSSAENFAEGAIKILNVFEGSDITLSFGSECGDLNELNQIADILYKEPKKFKAILSHELSKGLSYPKARENALLLYLNNVRKYSSLLSEPNNILGIEYLKAIKKFKYNIHPLTIKRIDSGYNSYKIKDRLASATAIRKLIKNNKNIRKLVPACSYSIITNNIKQGTSITDISSFEKEIIYNLRTKPINQISEYNDVSEGLENLIKNAANSCNNIEEIINIVKSKRYTRTRIQRILLYSLLDITKKDMLNSKKITPYIRVLGVNNRGRHLLPYINDPQSNYSIITSVKKFLNINNNNNKSIKLLNYYLEKDIYATNIYTLGYKKNSSANLDYTKKIITLK